jgi:hypothetical protein
MALAAAIAVLLVGSAALTFSRGEVKRPPAAICFDSSDSLVEFSTQTTVSLV